VYLFAVSMRVPPASANSSNCLALSLWDAPPSPVVAEGHGAEGDFADPQARVA
jgi:hypothetical protein